MADPQPKGPEQLGVLVSQLSERLRVLAAQSRAGELDAAEQGLNAVVAEAREAGLPELAAQGLYRLSFVHDMRGDYYTSAAELKAALDIAGSEGLHDLAAACHFSRGRQLMLRGRLREAEDALEAALADASRGGSDSRRGDVYAMHARCCLWQGRLADALSYIQEAVSLLDKTGGPALLHTLALGMNTARQLGMSDDEEGFRRRTAALSNLSNYPKVMSEGLALEAHDLMSTGHLDQASERLHRAESMLERGSSAGLQLLLARAKWMGLQGELEETYVVYMEAQRLAQRRQSRYEIAWIRLERAAGLIALGSLEQAFAMLTDAELAFEHFGAQINLGCCYCGWVRYFLAVGNRTAAQAVLAQAEAIAARLGSALGLQFAADLRWSRHAIAGNATTSLEPSALESQLPLLHPASTLQ